MTTKKPAKETTDRPDIRQKDVDLDPTGGMMHVKTGTISGPGEPGTIRDDIGKLEQPYGLYYFYLEKDAWEALASVQYKAEDKWIEIVQSSARVGDDWKPVVHVNVDGRRVTKTCDPKACQGTGMPAEVTGPLTSGKVKYDLARGGTFFGQYKIKLDYSPPSP